MSAVSVWVAPVGDTLPLRTDTPVRVALNDQAPRAMASLMKLFTTGAALMHWGPARRWRTEVGLGAALPTQGPQAGHLQGPLYWRASGDPSLDATRLLSWLSSWRQAGLQHLEGDIVVDRSVFARPEHDPAAFDGEPWRPYNAGPDPLLIAHQATTLVLRHDPDQGWRAQLSPPLAGVEVDTSGLRAEAAPRACGAWRGRLSVTAGPAPQATAPQATATTALPPWVLKVQGPLPAACEQVQWPLLWTGNGPGDHAERVIRALWTQLGGTWQGRLVSGSWPAQLPVWQAWESPPLTDVVRDINKYSNNVMARQLMLSLPERPGLGLSDARLMLAQSVSRDVAACGPDTLALDNGSGLSRTEGSSARCMGLWLSRLWRSPVMPEFMASLPVPGLDGTTRRWSGAAGQAHIKTGSLDGVAGVAGYVLGLSGQRYVVVAVVNHEQSSKARPWLDALLNWVRNDQNWSAARLKASEPM